MHAYTLSKLVSIITRNSTATTPTELGNTLKYDIHPSDSLQDTRKLYHDIGHRLRVINEVKLILYPKYDIHASNSLP